MFPAKYATPSGKVGNGSSSLFDEISRIFISILHNIEFIDAFEVEDSYVMNHIQKLFSFKKV